MRLGRLVSSRCFVLLAFVLAAFWSALLPTSTLPADGFPSPPTAEAAQRDVDYVPGRVLVRLRGDGAGGSQNLSARHSLEVVNSVAALNIHVLAVPEGQESVAVEALSVDPGVIWAQREAINRVLVVPNDPLYRDWQWNMRQIGMESAWEITQGDGSVTVAVLDTGVDLDHPDLAANLMQGYDFLNDDPVPEDDSAHGTHTAGIIGARGNNEQGVAGVAWHVKLMPIKVLNSEGLGPESAMVRGIVYAADQGARVINISSGTNRRSPALADAVAYAYRKGALVVAAAGNSGDGDNPVIYPAAYPEVLAVGATDRDGRLASFSQRHDYVQLLAPGVDIASTAWGPDLDAPYAMATGTSAAAPHVSGLAALIWSLDPSLTNSQVVELMAQHARAPGSEDSGEGHGRGLIDAARTLATLAALPDTPPAEEEPLPPTEEPDPQPLPTLAPLPTADPLPQARSDWYFAEGSTKLPFHTWLHVLNPNTEPSVVTVSYLLSDGGATDQTLLVQPMTRTAVFVNQVIPESDFALHVQSNSTVFVERAMFFGRDGHVTAGASSASRTWFLADGGDTGTHDSWLLLQNPNAEPATARLAFIADDGTETEFVEHLPPRSRRTLYVNLLIEAQSFSTTIVADRPIVAEQATYLSGGRGGYATVGVNSPSRRWYVAEGSTQTGFETWLIVQNPNDGPTEVRIRYFSEQGDPIEQMHTVPPRGHNRIRVNDSLDERSFGAMIESDAPVVVERTMRFGDDGLAGHTSSGIVVPSLDWYLAEGSTRAPFETFVAVLNPNAEPVDLEVTLMPAIEAEPMTLTFQMSPQSRLTLDLNQLAPHVDLSTRVRASAPVVVERSMYFDGGNGGTNTPGIPR